MGSGYASDFDFRKLADLALSDDYANPKVAVQAYDLESQNQKKFQSPLWNSVTAFPFERLLCEVFSSLQPTKDDHIKRLSIVQRLSDILYPVELFKGVLVVPFGSFESNLYTRWGDLDLSLELPENNHSSWSIDKTKKKTFLKLLKKILLNTGGAYKVQFIPHARVPLLTFVDSCHHISCDVSVDNGIALLKSRLLGWISDMDPRCRHLIFLVKCWAKAHCINDPKTGTLNSFALCLLVVFHLQTRSPPILPPLNAIILEDIASKLLERRSQHFREHLQEECREKIQVFLSRGFGTDNKSSLGELFVSFFLQFSSVAGLWSQGLAVSTFTGKWGDRTNKDQWINKQYVIIVEDPFDRSENCARSVQEYALQAISHAFSSTAEALYHPPDYYTLPLLREHLFCWPVGTVKPGARPWRKTAPQGGSPQGNTGQKKEFRKYPKSPNESFRQKFVSGGSNKPGQTFQASHQYIGAGVVRGSENKSVSVTTEVAKLTDLSSADSESGWNAHSKQFTICKNQAQQSCASTCSMPATSSMHDRKKMNNKEPHAFGFSKANRSLSSERVFSNASGEGELQYKVHHMPGHVIEQNISQHSMQDEILHLEGTESCIKASQILENRPRSQIHADDCGDVHCEPVDVAVNLCIKKSESRKNWTEEGQQMFATLFMGQEFPESSGRVIAASQLDLANQRVDIPFDYPKSARSVADLRNEQTEHTTDTVSREGRPLITESAVASSRQATYVLEQVVDESVGSKSGKHKMPREGVLGGKTAGNESIKKHYVQSASIVAAHVPALYETSSIELKHGAISPQLYRLGQSGTRVMAEDLEENHFIGGGPNFGKHAQGLGQDLNQEGELPFQNSKVESMPKVKGSGVWRKAPTKEKWKRKDGFFS